MRGTPTARVFGLHRSGRKWRGNCPSCGYCNTFVLTERRGCVLSWCASCRDQDFVTRLFRGEDCAEASATQATRAVEEARLRERTLTLAVTAARGKRHDPRAEPRPA
jgi:hypothetical protein